ncbi:hypothetical protein PC129_g13626 [Phytophthora cactorum]|nr:hypothetical protein Pcac1_g5846 [Phytophthora cactorum]KAG2813052.1 hypothetical protein PC112_g14903 [Phytophthora cactorum]KAG2852356.1 hypothetical protein PC113_g15087 [Phytophthora cactorum]KAG2891452.1 hypothetical protein PC114_g16980 [Phytophthora cactorum]KAG2904603.1 hypothetical protein PC115_g14925 [Phytophthora cactorum]
MANKKKRSRVQVASAPAAPLPSEQKPKKKAKFAFSKTLTTDAKIKAAATDKSMPQDVKEQPIVKLVAEISSTDGAKKKKKKNKSSGAVTNDPAATDQAEKPKATSGEIDDLFASLKTVKQKKSIADEQQKLAEEEEERREKKEKERLQQQIKKLEAQNTNSTAVGLNPDPRPVRYDEDGLPIYSEASLQIGKGGNTKDCPFDCWCCF